MVYATDQRQCEIEEESPSGSTEPSPEDQEVTEKLARVGEILGIKLLDHVIVTRNGYYSFKDQGLM